MTLPQVDYSPLYNALSSKRTASQASFLSPTANIIGKQRGLQRQSIDLKSQSLDLQQQSVDLQQRAFDLRDAQTTGRLELQERNMWITAGLQGASLVLDAVQMVGGIIKERNFQQAKNDVVKVLPDLQKARMIAIANGEYEYVEENGKIVDITMGAEYNQFVDDSISRISEQYNAFPEIKGWVEESITSSSNSQKVEGYQQIFAKESAMTMKLFDGTYNGGISSAVQAYDPTDSEGNPRELTPEYANQLLENVNAHIDSAGYLSGKEKSIYKQNAQAQLADGAQKKTVEVDYRKYGYSATMDGIAGSNLSPERKEKLSKFVTNMDTITREQNRQEDNKLYTDWEGRWATDRENSGLLIQGIQKLQDNTHGKFNTNGLKEHWIGLYSTRFKMLGDEFSATAYDISQRNYFISLTDMTTDSSVDEETFAREVKAGQELGYFDRADNDSQQTAKDVKYWYDLRERDKHGLTAGTKHIQTFFEKLPKKQAIAQYLLTQWRLKTPNADEGAVLEKAQQLTEEFTFKEIGENIWGGAPDFNKLDAAETRLQNLRNGVFDFTRENDWQQFLILKDIETDKKLIDLPAQLTRNLDDAWAKDFAPEMENFKGPTPKLTFENTPSGGLIPIITMFGTSDPGFGTSVPWNKSYTVLVPTATELENIKKQARLDQLIPGQNSERYFEGVELLKPGQEFWMVRDGVRATAGGGTLWLFDSVLGNRMNTGDRYGLEDAQTTKNREERRRLQIEYDQEILKKQSNTRYDPFQPTTF